MTTENQLSDNQIRQLILDVVKERKPETTKQLIALMHESHSIPQEKTTSIVVELEKDNLLGFKRQEQLIPDSAKAYILSSKTQWFWLTIALSVATIAAVFVVPESNYFAVYLRSALSLVFILFIPGYTCINLLLSTQVPIITPLSCQIGVKNENIDTIERVVLSVGLSLAFVAIIGLGLNYTPWGITLIPITFSLISITFTLATIALIREYQKIHFTHDQLPETAILNKSVCKC